MIFRLSGRVYVITSDMLNPSQIRFPNRPTSRLTTAFGAEMNQRRLLKQSTPEPEWHHSEVIEFPLVHLCLSPSPHLPSADPRPLINTAVIYPLSPHKRRVTTYITAFLIESNKVSLFFSVRVCAKKNIAVCLIDKITREERALLLSRLL